MKKLIIIILFNYILSNNIYAFDIKKSGDIVQILIPSVAYGTTFYLHDQDGRNQFYKSFASTFATTHILKRTVKEERPNKNNTQSFPSGHTSASFQGATFIHMRYGLKYAVIPYIGATFVAYSRVHEKEHYRHDVMAGAIIGSGFSYYFTTPYKYKNLQIQPIAYNSINYNANLYGLKVTW